MKIILKNLHGSLGDIRPFLALALTLRKSGHEVEFCTSLNFQPLCSQYGFKVHCFEYNSQKVAEEQAKDFVDPGKRLQTSIKLVQKSITDEFMNLKEVANGADLFIGSGVDIAGLSVAEYFGIPYRYVCYVPLVFKSHHHAPMVIPFQHLPVWVRRLGWWATDYFGNMIYGKITNTNRKQLGLPEVDFYKFLASLFENTLVVADPVLAPIPEDVRVNYFQTGYWHLEEEQELDDDLNRFITAGDPPVYIGFGSMTDPSPAQTAEILQKLIDSQRFRLVISRGWAQLGINKSYQNAFLVDHLPHTKLFPKMAAVVHHGGSGTTHTVAKAGIPQVIVPHFNDQFYYGERILRLQLGPKPIGRRRLSYHNLAVAIEAAVTNPVLRENAVRIGKAVNQHNGLHEALNYIEKIPK